MNQSMPSDIKEQLVKRQNLKEEERQLNNEMRRIAEEEIMRELKMAEDLYQTSQFQKTNRNL